MALTQTHTHARKNWAQSHKIAADARIHKLFEIFTCIRMCVRGAIIQHKVATLLHTSVCAAQYTLSVCLTCFHNSLSHLNQFGRKKKYNWVKIGSRHRPLWQVCKARKLLHMHECVSMCACAHKCAYYSATIWCCMFTRHSTLKYNFEQHKTNKLTTRSATMAANETTRMKLPSIRHSGNYAHIQSSAINQPSISHPAIHP